MLAAKKFDHHIELPDECERFSTPGGHYAIFDYQGKADSLFMRGNYILGTWLPHSGYWLGSGPAIVKMKMNHPQDALTAQFCIPLRKRKTKTQDPWWDTDER